MIPGVQQRIQELKFDWMNGIQDAQEKLISLMQDIINTIRPDVPEETQRAYAVLMTNELGLMDPNQGARGRGRQQHFADTPVIPETPSHQQSRLRACVQASLFQR